MDRRRRIIQPYPPTKVYDAAIDPAGVYRNLAGSIAIATDAGEDLINYTLLVSDPAAAVTP